MNENKKVFEGTTPEKFKNQKNTTIPNLTLENIYTFTIPYLNFVNRKQIANSILDLFSTNNGINLSEKYVLNLCQNFGAGKSALIENLIGAAELSDEEKKKYKICNIDLRTSKDEEYDEDEDFLKKIKNENETEFKKNFGGNVNKNLFNNTFNSEKENKLLSINKIGKKFVENFLKNNLSSEIFTILENRKNNIKDGNEELKILINFDEINLLFKSYIIEECLQAMYNFWNGLNPYIDLKNVLISFSGKVYYLSLIGCGLFKSFNSPTRMFNQNYQFYQKN
jgi:hypothetical protein